MLIRATYFSALLATVSAVFLPSLPVAWVACILWGVHFYSMHEQATLAGKSRTATALVVFFGVLIAAFYALAADSVLFAAMIVCAVALTLALRAVLPRHFPQPVA